MSNETNVATATTATVIPISKPELQSEKLTALKAAFLAAFRESQKIDDPFSDAYRVAKLAVVKAENEIAIEKAALLKAENDAAAQLAKNARIELNTDQFAAYDNLLAVKANKKATADEIAAAQLAFDTAKNVVETELCAKFANSKPASVKADNGQSGTRNTDAKAAILEMYLAGKSHNDIEAAGFPKSTVWHVIDKYKKANGIAK